MKNKEDLKRLYEERFSLYKKYSDITIENNTNVKDAIKKITKEILLWLLH